MKAIFIAILLCVGNANAGDRTLALKIICLPMKQKPEFTTCVDAIREFSYFENAPLVICASMKLNTDKIICMESVGDATFKRSETDFCATKITDADKQDCLNSAGEIHNPLF